MNQADRVIRFIETFLTLGGSYAGQPFKLMPWQRDLLGDIYLEDGEGNRLRRTYVLGVPRKNGKSQICAALALYHLIADTSDARPLVVSAAGDRAQAKLVFDEAKRMVQASPDLAEVCQVFQREIRCTLNGGKYIPVSADAGLQQGLNPSMVVFDELHVFKKSDLFEALQMGSAARKAPLTVVISTAGYDLESPLGKLYRYGRKVAAGEVDDPAFGFTWYGPLEGEDFGDYQDPKVWERFNPAWPIMNPAVLESALGTTSEAAFIRYHLNGWTSSETAWLPAGAWANCETERRLLPGERVVLGFDGSWRGDSTALIAESLEDSHIQVLGHWERPEHARPEWRMPTAEIEDAIRGACRTYQVEEVACDIFRWEQSFATLQDEGLPMVEFPNTVQRMVPATQAFYESVMDQSLSHDGDPALARHVGNCVLREDARGARITKQTTSSVNKIDLAVAAVMAHARVKVWREAPPVREPQVLIL